MKFSVIHYTYMHGTSNGTTQCPVCVYIYITDPEMASTFSNDGNRDQGVAGGGGAAVSARKLAASLWQLAVTTGCGGDVRWQCRLSDGLGFEFCSAPSTPKSSMEGVTKWDYSCINGSCDISHGRLPGYEERETTSVAPPMQAGLSKNKKCMNKHKAEGLSRTRLKRCTKKLNEEGASWMTKEHQQICGAVQELKDDFRRARKNCNKMYILHTNLLSEIAEAKSSASKFMHSYVKEKKARELLEDLCIEQAKELEANKAEIEELRTQCARIQQEVVEDRKMLQMAEAWREERAQMKLVDAKLTLEDKYSQMNTLIENMEELLRSSNYAKNINEKSNANVLEEVSDTRKMQGIQEFLCTLPNLDKEFINIDLEASHSAGTSVQSSILSGSGCSSGDTSGKETIRQAKTVADHECQKPDSCIIEAQTLELSRTL